MVISNLNCAWGGPLPSGRYYGKTHREVCGESCSLITSYRTASDKFSIYYHPIIVIKTNIRLIYCKSALALRHASQTRFRLPKLVFLKTQRISANQLASNSRTFVTSVTGSNGFWIVAIAPTSFAASRRAPFR